MNLQPDRLNLRGEHVSGIGWRPLRLDQGWKVHLLEDVDGAVNVLHLLLDVHVDVVPDVPGV